MHTLVLRTKKTGNWLIRRPIEAKTKKTIFTVNEQELSSKLIVALIISSGARWQSLKSNFQVIRHRKKRVETRLSEQMRIRKKKITNNIYMLITVVLCRIVDLKVTTHRSACYAQLQSNRPFFFFLFCLRSCSATYVVRFPPSRVDSSPAALCPSHHSLSFSLLSFHFSVMLFSRVSRLFLALSLCVTQFSHSLCALCSIYLCIYEGDF